MLHGLILLAGLVVVVLLSACVAAGRADRRMEKCFKNGE